MAAASYFPLFVDLSEKKAVIVGAGKIAGRRAGVLAQFTKDLTVVAPDISPELEKMEKDGEIRILRKRYEREDLYGADLVIAATDSRQVNEDIYAACKCLGILVNVCSDKTKCDFYFPGIVKQDNVVVGVTAGGSDHAGARNITARIREMLAAQAGREKES